METFDTHELAWCAGFFDGEGSTCLQRKGGWRELWVQVPQSELSTLERFQRAVGGRGKIGGPWQPKYAGSKPTYRLDFRGYREAQFVLALLWRFLSEPKRQQATVCLVEAAAYFKERAAYARKGPSKLTLAQAAEIRAARDQARIGRQRVPRNWVVQVADLYGVSTHCIATVLSGRGHIQ
jgi:hypothetical protein